MKKLLAVIGVIILILPSILAFKVYKDTLKEESEREILQSIEITDREGNVHTFKKGNREFDFLKGLSSLGENSVSTREELLKMTENSELSKDNPKCIRFPVIYKTNHKEHSADIFVTDVDRIESYVIYFSHGEGPVYCFGEDEQKEFLSLEFTYTVSDAASIPTVILAEKEYKPYKAVWKIKNSNGEFTDVDVPEGSAEMLESLSESFSFSVQPDEVNVKVYGADNSELLSGGFAELAAFKPQRSGTVTVDVNAFWYQKDNQKYAGNATYRFTAEVDAEPLFKLSATEVEPGGTLLLSCLNIPTDSITVAAMGESAIPLYRSGSDLFAIIPFSYDTTAGTHTLNIMMGTEVVKLDITVKSKSFITTKSISASQMPADAFAAATNEAAMTEYRTLLSEIAKGESNELFYSGTLKNYEDSFKLYKGYGLYVPYQSGGGAKIRNDGVFFTAKSGSLVEAMADGKVADVGLSAYLGKYIVIDHGYGLRTWYGTLGETNVEVGDSVKKGDKIAKTGSGGIAPKENMIIMVTVGSTPVSPYPFWEGERKFPQ